MARADESKSERLIVARRSFFSRQSMASREMLSSSVWFAFAIELCVMTCEKSPVVRAAFSAVDRMSKEGVAANSFIGSKANEPLGRMMTKCRVL